MKHIALRMFMNVALLAGIGFLLLATTQTRAEKMTDSSKLQKATLGGGCFWCLEAVYEQLEGVHSVISGYSGGPEVNPSYNDVCSGQTGHAEVVQVTFDPGTVSYAEILDWFWKIHDPTTLNRQGNDIGPQYRSIILYHDAEQKEVAEKSLANAQSAFDKNIVTELVPLDTFYEAEAYHQDYYRHNKSQSYCTFVIRPKLKKLELEP
jgi:peptide-methionine (S)-S-oxide reductase